MTKAIFVFTPSHQQQQYLEFVFDSIAKYISIPYQFCLFTDKVMEGFESKYDVLIKTVDSADHMRLKEIFYKENRGDIPPFSAYAQLIMPRYFKEFKSFIYMEVDQIVKADLADLWKICESSSSPLAAVRFLDDDLQVTTVESFNRINPGAKCYNTGVLYINIEEWINRNFESLCFREVSMQKEQLGKRLDFYAQGAINNALHSYIMELGCEYNLPGFGSVRGIRNEEIQKAKVLHWTGPRKPWASNGLYKDLYFSNSSLKNDSDYKLTFPYLNLAKIRIKRFARNILWNIRLYMGRM